MDKVCNLCRQKIIIETGCAVLLILVANLNKIFQETKLNKEVELLINGNRAALSRTITLIESTLESDKNKAD